MDTSPIVTHYLVYFPLTNISDICLLHDTLAQNVDWTYEVYIVQSDSGWDTYIHILTQTKFILSNQTQVENKIRVLQNLEIDQVYHPPSNKIQVKKL